MKPKIFLKLLWLLLVSVSPVLAQSEEDTRIPPPKPPFIARVSVPSAWTITFTRPASEETIDLDALRKFAESSGGPEASSLEYLNDIKEPIAKPMVRILRVTRSRDFTKEVAKFSDESEETAYIFNVARIYRHTDYEGLIRSRRDQSVASISPNFSVADFAGFDWLSHKNYKGVQKVLDRTCYFFEDEIETEQVKMATSMGNTPDGETKTTARAFINVESKLPVALQLGRENRVYAFGKPSPADLNLPPEVAAEIKDWRAELTSATKAAPPP
jgi:hypothetical protein